jgi:hypothetical protein
MLQLQPHSESKSAQRRLQRLLLHSHHQLLQYQAMQMSFAQSLVAKSADTSSLAKLVQR